jgi:hypothetical protein
MQADTYRQITDLKVAKGLALQDILTDIHTYLVQVDLTPKARIFLLEQIAAIEERLYGARFSTDKLSVRGCLLIRRMLLQINWLQASMHGIQAHASRVSTSLTATPYCGVTPLKCCGDQRKAPTVCNGGGICASA